MHLKSSFTGIIQVSSSLRPKIMKICLLFTFLFAVASSWAGVLPRVPVTNGQLPVPGSPEALELVALLRGKADNYMKGLEMTGDDLRLWYRANLPFPKGIWTEDDEKAFSSMSEGTMLDNVRRWIEQINQFENHYSAWRPKSRL